MPTKDGFAPDHSLPPVLADEPEQQGTGKPRDRAVMWSRVLKASILVATFGVVILGLMLFADVTASLVDKSALQPGTDQSTPTNQSTADAAEALQPTPKDAATSDEIAGASESAGQKTESSELSQFQVWTPEKDAQAQVGPAQSVQYGTGTGCGKCLSTSPAHAKAPPAQSIAARSELPPVQNPRKKVHREKNARAQVPPVQHPRAQDRSAQNAQAPSFLQIFGWRN